MRRFFDLSLPMTAGIIALGAVVWVATNHPAMASFVPCLARLPV